MSRHAWIAVASLGLLAACGYHIKDSATPAKDLAIQAHAQISTAVEAVLPGTKVTFNLDEPLTDDMGDNRCDGGHSGTDVSAFLTLPPDHQSKADVDAAAQAIAQNLAAARYPGRSASHTDHNDERTMYSVLGDDHISGADAEGFYAAPMVNGGGTRAASITIWVTTECGTD